MKIKIKKKLFQALTFVFLSCLFSLNASYLNAQQAYFVDGYHGGVWGHYPEDYTEFLMNELEENPDWKINLEIEPETVESGLRTNDGEAPAHFMLAGKDQVFHPAKARIAGNKVQVVSNQVEEPAAVRYAFTNYAVTNLENGEELPAVPFRSDKWPENREEQK